MRIENQAWNETIEISGKPTFIEHAVNIGRDSLDIKFSCEVPGSTPSAGDPQEMEVSIENFDLEW